MERNSLLLGQIHDPCSLLEEKIWKNLNSQHVTSRTLLKRKREENSMNYSCEINLEERLLC